MDWLRALLRRWQRPASRDEVEPGALRDLQRRLGYRFRDVGLLVTALKHRSYVYARNGHGIESNERLEYLGDAVLDLVVAEFLFRRFDDRREGDLTQMKSLVVSRPVLARKGLGLSMDTSILLSADERASGGGRQPSILCDALEALIGAVYLDGGLEAARALVRRHVLDDFEDLLGREDYVNFKSRLLEHTQSTGSGHPRYLVHAEEGPDHCKVFCVEVSVTGESLGWGRGHSKKEAQQMAARDALQRLGAL